jgi:hypothetical protein
MVILIYGYIYKKKTHMKIVLQLTLMILLTSTQIHSQCTHPDYAGLMELYYSTGGPNWTNNTGWKEGAAGTNCDPCSGWKGVSCNDNRVMSINLSSNNLVGIIPNISLQLLKSFSCLNNKLSGSIPDFTNLPNLIYFNCLSNKLSGSIPDFKNLPNLNFFICVSNQLSGSIPDFSALPNLAEFYCSYNQLSGSIPDFKNLPILSYLDCGNNQLSGSIPDFKNLPKLLYFICNNNQLSGSIPDFKNLPILSYLDCGNNLLTGNLPKIKSTTFIDLSKNNFVGCIPNEYCLNPIKYIKNDSLIINGEIIVDRDTICRVNISQNPKLPFQGDIEKFCENGGISTGAPCDDGLATTIEDHILQDCSCLGAIADTCLVTIYDTLIVRDTITQFVTDTTFITITKEVAVTDTLIINLNLMNSTNQPVINTVLVYPNPASSHIYVDTGDPALLENYDMQILNALGQPVYFTSIDKKIYYIDLNGWSGKGTYFLRIKNPAGVTIQTKKIILQ